jgi:phage shock protein A
VILANTLYTMFLIGSIGAVLFLAMNTKSRNLISVSYQLLMRSLTGMVIDLNPISILKNYIDYLNEKMQELNENSSKLKGEMTKLRMTIDANENAKNNALSKAKLADEKGIQGLKIINARDAVRRTNSNITLSGLYNKMDVLYKMLSKFRDNAGYLIQDITSEVEVREAEYNAVKASSSALKSAMSIIQGDPDKKGIFDQAMESLNNTVGMKVGEIEDFINVSQTFMDSMDLENGQFDDKGLQMLEDFEKKADNLLLMGESSPSVSQSVSVSSTKKSSKSSKDDSKSNPFKDVI